MGNVDSFEELRQEIDRRGGLLTLKMEVLRDLGGYGRLGKHVVTEVSNKLEGLGITHYPKELPQSQTEHVRLYIRGSAISELINAVLKVGEEQDRTLRAKVASDAEDVLRKVRALVCD